MLASYFNVINIMKEEYGLHLETDEDSYIQSKCKCSECNLKNNEEDCPLLQKVNFFISEIKRTQDAHQRLIDKVCTLKNEIYN